MWKRLTPLPALLAGAALAGEAAADHIYPGQWYQGVSVQLLKGGATLEQCRSACYQHPTCRGWSYAKSNSPYPCYGALGEYAKLAPNAAWTSGAVHRRVPKVIGHLTFPGKMYAAKAGQWLAEYGTNTLAKCQFRCWERSNCVSWTWDVPASSGICYHILVPNVPLIDNKTSTSGWIDRSIQTPPGWGRKSRKN